MNEALVFFFHQVICISGFPENDLVDCSALFKTDEEESSHTCDTNQSKS